MHNTISVRDILVTYGRQKAMADFAVSNQALQKWIDTNRVPAGRVLDVEAATGVSRHDLRPDIFGPREGAAA